MSQLLVGNAVLFIGKTIKCNQHQKRTAPWTGFCIHARLCNIDKGKCVALTNGYRAKDNRSHITVTIIVMAIIIIKANFSCVCLLYRPGCVRLYLHCLLMKLNKNMYLFLRKKSFLQSLHCFSRFYCQHRTDAGFNSVAREFVYSRYCVK